MLDTQPCVRWNSITICGYIYTNMSPLIYFNLCSYNRSELMVVAFCSVSNSSAIVWQEQVTFQWYDYGVRFVPDQHAYVIVLGNWNKSQRVDLTLHMDIQLVFAVVPTWWLVSGKATNTNCIVFELCRLGIDLGKGPTTLESNMLTITQPVRLCYNLT